MKKMISIILCLMLSLQLFSCSTALSDVPAFSSDAFIQYCNYWNEYFNKYDPMLFCDYAYTDDNKTIGAIYIVYNSDQMEIDYGLQEIPATSDIMFAYDIGNDIYYFGVFSDQKKGDLQKVVIYLDNDVLNNISVDSTHEDPDMWSVTLKYDDVDKIFSQNSFTIKLTIDGQNKFLDISRESNPYLFIMFQWLIGGQLYSNTAYTEYRNIRYLPGGSEAASTQSTVQPAVYSFQQDYEGIEKAANSLFYVEMYNSNNAYVSNASGFVSFDEHLFVTNQHVIEGGAYLKIWDEENNVYKLDKVVASDKEHDIAILLFPDGSKYGALELNAEEKLMRGQPVTTIGSPQGFQNTVAFGNISAFPTINGIRYIQFTAPISHGSSGGCLLNDEGKVIGITSAGLDEGQNINFAIPINLVQELYAQWDKSSYEVLGSERSWDMVSITPTPAPTVEPPKADTLSIGVILNRYGIINHRVNFRSGPSVDSELAGDPLKTGSYVYIIENEINSQGEVWSKICLNGIIGYVKSEYIYALDQKDSDIYDKSQATPAPIYTVTPTPEYGMLHQANGSNDLKMYYLPQKKISVAIPETYEVITLDTEETASLDKEQVASVHEVMSQYGNYMDAFSSDFSREITVNVSDNIIASLGLISDDLFDYFLSDIEESFESGGASVMKMETVKENNIRIIKLWAQYGTGYDAYYCIQYGTVIDRQSIWITLISYDGYITQNDEVLIDQIWRSSDLSIHEESDTKIFDMDSNNLNYYTNSESGFRFAIPNGWEEVPLRKERQHVKTKICPNGNVEAACIVYSQSDVFSSLSSFQKYLWGLSTREDVDKYLADDIYDSMSEAGITEIKEQQINGMTFYVGKMVQNTDLVKDIAQVELVSSAAVVIKNGYYIMFQFSDMSNNHKYQSAFDLVLNSFRLN